MTYPETVWEYSKDTEAQRILFVARMIQSYFYQIKGFLVLPKVANRSVSTIYFPNLPIVHHPYFWQIVQNFTQNEEKTPKDLLGQLKNDITLSQPPMKIREEWEKIAPQFWEMLRTFIPEIGATIKKLVIRQTEFGSQGSSVTRIKKEPGVVTIYLRFDAKLSHIASAFFIATLDNASPKGMLYGFKWEERQAIGDFLLTHTSLATLFPKHESTLLSVRSYIKEEQKAASKRFLTELGFPPKKLFEVNEHQQIVVNDQTIPLRKKEQDVLTLLIEKRNQVVSTNHIAQRLWAEDSDQRYSLYAISKVIERLRKHVQAAGIYPEIIETRRGQGFILND